jgi:ATP-dependent Clp protease adaptor protein ClpS
MEPVRATDIKDQVRLAPQCRVLIHNDDVTPMDFVVLTLLEVFKKNEADAIEIMLTAHNTGVALVAVLPLEEAELRVDQAHSKARTAKYPLTFTCEPE